MKNTKKAISLTAAALMLCAFTPPAPNSGFEGVVTYSINATGGDENPQMAQMMQGASQKMYIKGDMCRTEKNMGMMNNIVITNKNKPKEPIILLDIMGNKYQLKIDDKMQKEMDNDNKPEIKYLTGTKKIAGYDCMEAQVTVKDKKGKSVTCDVYYTDKLPYDTEGNSLEFKGLKGFPLSYNMSENGMNVNYMAQSVQQQSVPDSLFNLPKGYKLMTQDEMQKDLQKQMGGGGE